MLPVFAYIRISRDRTGAGLNIADQLNDIRPAAQSAGHHIAEVYADNDMSAYSGKPRPDYLRLLDDIRAGRWKAGWAWHTDRLHRSPLELEDWITACEPHGTALWTVKAGPIDLTTPSGRLVARQLGAVARYESEHKSERLKLKIQGKVQRREPLSGGGYRPFGWEEDRVTVREDEAEVIRWLAQQIFDGVGLRTLARQLTDRGVPTTTGGPWYAGPLRDILLRPRIAGLYTHKERIIGQAPWPPIIPEPQWRSLVAILRDPTRRTGGRSGRTNLLTGLAVCDTHPDQTLRVVYASNKRPTKETRQRRWYFCPRCRRRRNTTLVDGYVQDAVVAYLSGLELEPAPQPPPEEPGLLEELERARRRRDEIAALADDPDWSLEELRAMRRAAAERVAQIEARMSRAVRPRVVEGIAGRPVEEVLALWGDMGLEWLL
jgi:site-specific DNA recombinase